MPETESDEPSVPEPSAPEPRAPKRERVDELFASLRDVAPPADQEPEPELAAQPDDAGRVQDPAATNAADDALRTAREELLDGLVADVLRDVKRLLQDEQNDLLDATRRAKARVDASRLVPDSETARGTWAVVLTRAIDDSYAAGRLRAGRKPRPGGAPRRLVEELAASAGAPLRDRLAATITAIVAEGPYETTRELQRALATAIGARYREWKTRDVEPRLGDVLAAAYARGAYDAAPTGARLRWVVAEVGQCPDADDNALEPTVKGRPFPTGQAYPPAHPGCRCVVVPADI